MEDNTYKFGFYSLLMLLAALLVSPASFATPPTPPVSISATLEPIYGVLKERRASYTIELVQREKSKRVSVQAFLTPVEPGRLSNKRDSIYRKRVDVQEILRLEIPLTIKQPGLYELYISISGEIDDDNGYSDSIQRYVAVQKDLKYRIISPKQLVSEKRRARERRFEAALKRNPDSPDIRLLHEDAMQVPKKMVNAIRPHETKNQLIARPVGPSKQILKYVEPKSDSAWSPEDPLTIRGRLTYLDYDGVWRPLVNVSVNIYDEDTGFDDHLGTTGTDWNGNWSFSVNNDDGWLADGRDIYYTFKLENTRIRVQDCDGIDSTYKWQSSVHDNLSDGTVLDFGTETGSTNTNSMQIWNMLNQAWSGAVTLGGRDPGFVDSCFPEGSGARWDRFWEEIDIPGADNDAPDVVTHEYGHAVMYYAYGSDNPSPGGSHGFGDDAQNASLAWSEGWGTGFMLALRPDGRYNWSEGDTGRNIENFSDAGNREGNRNEGRVAAAINDMLDNPNDDNGGNLDRGRDDVDDDNSPNRVSLSTLLNDTLWGSWHDDFEEFWTSLSGELSGATLGDANEIMYYNYMDVPEPISCVASKVAALDTESPDDVLEGLRRFRDHALKGFNGGQQLINVYYRNSPELALMLLRDPELRTDAVEVMNHFSELGFKITDNRQFSQLAQSRRPLIDKKMAKRIRSVLARVEKQASDSLKVDIEPLGRILSSVEGLDAVSVQQKLDDIKNKHPKSQRIQVRPSSQSDASREAAQSDEVRSTIKKYVPTYDQHK